MAFADGNIIIGTSVDVGGLNTGLKKIEKSFGKLGRLASLVLGVGAFVKLGKAALDAASDLQEVQNVVDVAFGKGTTHDMTGKIERFAETCIQDFGMSRFAAKQTAGSFMAMGKSMGLTMEEASDMSVALTGLTGDMASFLNISQDYARVALSAVYTGETETLKRYGIILTEANLQQYANSKGIDENVKKMDARNKAILRYQYIMEKTNYMVGDFQATQNSWANSTRVLSEMWKEFLIVLGSGLVSVLSPLVQVLGRIVARLTQFMTTLWQILSNIFGFQLQDLTSQSREIADNIEDGAGAMDDFGKATEKAGKKAHKQLATFDELNNLTTQTASGSGSGGVGGASGLGMGDSSLWDPSNKDNPWADIDNLRDLGKWIGDKLAKMMEDIDWEKVYRGAKNFGKGLADFLNGLFVDTDLLKDVGHTIAGALNTAIYAALSFGQTLEWGNIGKKLADGINEFFYTFDFKSFAEAINVWVQGLWEFIKETLTNIDWKAVFQGIRDFFSSLDPETVALIMGFIILRKLIKMSLMKCLMEGIKEGLGVKSLTSIFKTFGANIAKAWAGIKWMDIINSHQALLVIYKVLGQISSAWAAGAKLLFTGGNASAASSALGFMSTGIKLLAGIPAIITGLVISVKSFFDMWNDGWSVLKTILEAIGIALIAIGAIILGAPAAIVAIVAAVVFAVSQIVIVIHDNWDAICAWFKSVGAWIKSHVLDPIVNFFKEAGQKIKDFFQPVIDFFKGVFERVYEFARGCWILIKAGFIIARDFIKGILETIWNVLKAVFTPVFNWINTNVIQPVIDTFNRFKTTLVNIFNSVVNTFKSVWGSIVSFFSPIINKIVSMFTTAFNSIRNIFTSVFNAISNTVKSIFNGIIGAVQSVINAVINGINKFLNGFNNLVGKAAAITGDSWRGVSLLSPVSLPRLAKGAVIPPNNEFMAVLGDQKRGTNIEAPLDTIKQALAETMAQFGGGDDRDIVINIDGTEIFRVVRKQSRIYENSTGLKAF